MSNNSGFLKPIPGSGDDASGIESNGSRTPTLSGDIGSVESQKVEGWAPDGKFYALIVTLMVVVLAAALDATSLSVALPVRSPLSHLMACYHSLLTRGS